MFAKHTRNRGISLMEAVVALTLMGMVLGIILTAQSSYFAYRQSHQTLEACRSMLEDFLDGYRVPVEIRNDQVAPGVIFEDHYCRLEITSISSNEPPRVTVKLTRKGIRPLSRTFIVDYRIKR